LRCATNNFASGPRIRALQSWLLHRKILLFAIAAFLPVLQAQNPTYRFITNLGNVDVTLTPNAAPKTVANFLSYLNAGYYNNVVFHRSVANFIVQGGQYQYFPGQTPNLVAIPTSPAIQNEFNVSNTAGTIAMALVSGNANSATSQWFFNVVDNSGQLDSQSFTVFGSTNAAGLAVLKRINALPTVDESAVYGDSGLTTFPVSNSNPIVVSSIVPIPVFTAGGFESAASFASSSTTGISPGEVLTIFGSGLGPSQLTTLTIDSNGVVTKSLAGTQVTFNGTPAPVIYTSANQISVVAPYSISTLPVVSIAVSYNGVAAGNTLSFNVKAANPAIFTLNSSGSGDGVIVRYQGAGYSVISASNPASAGDVLTLFGEGYGVPTSSTAIPDGTIVTSTLPIPAASSALMIDGQNVNTSYFGGAPFEINGVLQVNFTVPQLTPGAHQIQLMVAGRTSPMGVTLQTK